MSPSFVFIGLERVLIPEFGDLICKISRWWQGVLWEGIGSFARLELLNCGAEEFSLGKTGIRLPGIWPTSFGAGQKRPLEVRPASRSRILSSLITLHASTLFN
jgi:hypothetical protein